MNYMKINDGESGEFMIEFTPEGMLNNVQKFMDKQQGKSHAEFPFLKPPISYSETLRDWKNRWDPIIKHEKW